MIFVGIDWAEAHHDICVLDAEGEVLATRRIPEGLEGVARLHALVGGHAERPDEVIVGIETDRGLLVAALVAAGYGVYAIDPLSASRYRDRHTTSGAKSDRVDARMLADLVRTDRHNHRPVACRRAPGEERHGRVYNPSLVPGADESPPRIATSLERRREDRCPPHLAARGPHHRARGLRGRAWLLHGGLPPGPLR